MLLIYLLRHRRQQLAEVSRAISVCRGLGAQSLRLLRLWLSKGTQPAGHVGFAVRHVTGIRPERKGVAMASVRRCGEPSTQGPVSTMRLARPLERAAELGP